VVTTSVRIDTFAYEAGGITCEAFVAEPEARSSTPRPCVLVGHDWSGINDGIKQVVGSVAELGFVAIALDVYGRGVRGDEDGDNSHLMGPLLEDRRELQRRLLDGFEVAKGRPGVDPQRMAVLGYCFGGLCALDLARQTPQGLLGAISVHGGLTRPPWPTTAKLDLSILLLHGWSDPIVPDQDVLDIAEELTHAGADWQLHVYGHAQHAFTFRGAKFPERGIEYHPRAAQRAWRAICSFLQDTLGDPSEL